VKVGVLALQGDVAEHCNALQKCGAEAVEVRTVGELEVCRGLVLPGGESTTIGKLLDRYKLLEPLRDKGRAGFPIYGTCAGLILLARDVQDGLPGQPTLGLMDFTAARNAYGRQVDSFEVEVDMPDVDPLPVPAVFIRAPSVVHVGSSATVLGRWLDKVVAVRQGALLATSFHPELTGDDRMHRYFLRLIDEHAQG
jgi:5'-phosphate synthase pdxT subunit